MDTRTLSTDENPQESDEVYTCFDLGLAAALVTSKHLLLEIDKTNPNKAMFVFAQDRELDESINRYWNDELMIDARTLVDNIKMLKTRLYSD